MEQKNEWLLTKNQNMGDLIFLTIAPTKKCNLNCTYCYVGGSSPDEMELETFKRVIDDAYRVGLKKILITGGEPTMYPHLFEAIDYLKSKNVGVLLVSNGTLINNEMATKFYERKVEAGISLQSIDSSIDDALTGSPGTFNKKMQAIENLIGAGYTKSAPMFLLINTFEQNYPTFIDTWKWALSKGIKPIFHRANAAHRCQKESVISPEHFEALLIELGKLESRKYVIPFPDNTPCNKYEVGCYVDANGDVKPCPGVELKAGNINEKPLDEIWKNSELLELGRNMKKNVKGKCAKCSNPKCYGCRADAFLNTGDITAEDPRCWKK